LDTYLPQPVKSSTTERDVQHEGYWYPLLTSWVIVRVDNSVNTKNKKARFPFISTLEEYDFTYQPKIDEKLIRELSTLHFLPKVKNIIFIWHLEGGKTHLAVAIGMKAAQARKRVLIYSAEDLVNDLLAHEISNRLLAFLNTLSRIDLLIIDERGYLALSKQSAVLFLTLISPRYEKTSTIITSNKPFEEWGEILADDVVAAALLNRLLHHDIQS